MVIALPPPARILVVGASRGIGRACVERALAEGYTVRALARSPEKIGLDHPKLALHAADATDPAEMAAALAGCDAVVVALGLPLTADTVLRKVTLFSDATRTITDAMAETGARRIVAVTGIGTSESRAALSSLERLPWRMAMGRIYDDKTRQEEVIRGSGLDWTLVRPAILTNGPRTGTYKVMLDRESWRNGLISRADVADFVIGTIRDGSHLHAAPVIAR